MKVIKVSITNSSTSTPHTRLFDVYQFVGLMSCIWNEETAKLLWDELVHTGECLITNPKGDQLQFKNESF